MPADLPLCFRLGRCVHKGQIKLTGQDYQLVPRTRDGCARDQSASANQAAPHLPLQTNVVRRHSGASSNYRQPAALQQGVVVFGAINTNSALLIPCAAAVADVAIREKIASSRAQRWGTGRAVAAIEALPVAGQADHAGAISQRSANQRVLLSYRLSLSFRSQAGRVALDDAAIILCQLACRESGAARQDPGEMPQRGTDIGQCDALAYCARPNFSSICGQPNCHSSAPIAISLPPARRNYAQPRAGQPASGPTAGPIGNP